MKEKVLAEAVGAHCLAVHPAGGEAPRVMYAGGANGYVGKFTKDGVAYGKKAGPCFEGHTGTVTCLAVNEAGDTVVTAATDKTVRAWKANGEPVKTMSHHSGWVRALALAGDALVTAGDAGEVFLLPSWSGDDPPVQLPGHADSVGSLVVDSASQQIFSGSFDRTARQWNLSGGACTAVYSGHTGHVRSVAVAKGMLLTASVDGAVRVWSIAKAEESEEGGSGRRLESGVCIACLDYGGMLNKLAALGSQAVVSTSGTEYVIHQLDIKRLEGLIASRADETKREYGNLLKTTTEAKTLSIKRAAEKHAKRTAKEAEKLRAAIKEEADQKPPDTAETPDNPAATPPADAPAEDAEADGGKPPQDDDNEEPAPPPEDGDAAGLQVEDAEFEKRFAAVKERLAAEHEKALAAVQAKFDAKMRGVSATRVFEVSPKAMPTATFSTVLAELDEPIRSLALSEVEQNTTLYFASETAIRRVAAQYGTITI